MSNLLKFVFKFKICFWLKRDLKVNTFALNIMYIYFDLCVCVCNCLDNNDSSKLNNQKEKPWGLLYSYTNQNNHIDSDLYLLQK
jgi:hypothetical protein